MDGMDENGNGQYGLDGRKWNWTIMDLMDQMDRMNWGEANS